MGGAAPNPAVKRLSLYLRRLQHLAAEGVEKVSSRSLAESLHLTDAQVRKDLAHFGQFGQPGVGYRVGSLLKSLRRILGTDKTWRVVVVGVGDLGRALLRYKGFRQRGFEVVAAFDVAGSKIGKRFGSTVVRHIDELPDACREHDVKLAIVTVPAEAAQDAADRLCRAGVLGILNFAPTTLNTSAGVAVGLVDLAASLEQLSFQVGNTR
jgi:redox-sensing transcriptional repressor